MKNNIDAIISQVMSGFKKYQNIIDEDNLYREVILAVRQFGGNIIERFETVLDVEFGKAVLPDNFYSLDLALICEEEKSDSQKEVIVKTLLGTSYSIEDTRQISLWNECVDCCKEQRQSLNSRSIFLTNAHGGKARCMQNFRPLKLKGHTSKAGCVNDSCKNKYFDNCKEEITIHNNIAYFNFNNGNVYLRYEGMPMDETGNLTLPETPNGHLEKYIEFVLKSYIVEFLLITEDGVGGLANMYQVYEQKKRYYHEKTKQELLFINLDMKNFAKKVKRSNQRDFIKNAVI